LLKNTLLFKTSLTRKGRQRQRQRRIEKQATLQLQSFRKKFRIANTLLFQMPPARKERRQREGSRSKQICDCKKLQKRTLEAHTSALQAD
jgi:hypothetical protein